VRGSLILLALALALSACSKKEQKGIDSSRVAAGPNGRLYLDGKPWTGPHVEYFGDGQVKVEGEFLDGRKNGRWVFYYQNGKIESEHFFNKDAQDGNETHRYNDELNTRSMVKEWKSGRLTGRYEWQPDGRRVKAKPPPNLNPMASPVP